MSLNAAEGLFLGIMSQGWGGQGGQVFTTWEVWSRWEVPVPDPTQARIGMEWV